MSAAAFAVALLSVAPPLGSQIQTAQQTSTRAEILARIREDKAKALTPYKPGRLEKLLIKVEDERMIEDFLETGSGFYVRAGKLTTGAGLAFGPGFKQRNLFEGKMAFDISAAASLRKYWMANGSVTFPRLWGGRGVAELYARHSDFPQEDFYGLGPDSTLEDQVSFLYRDSALGARLSARLQPFLLVAGTAERLWPSVGRGRDSSVPTLDEVFTPDQAPGYTERSDYMRYQLLGDLNYALPLGNPREGGRYIVSFNYYDDIERGYGFHRLELDLRQYLSFWKSRRVIALRSYFSMASPNDDDEIVPFYLMQTLGGHNTLRGFRNYRFRDANIMLVQVEYRWEIFPALDAALFYDTGKVEPSRGELNFENLEHDYGIGFRFGTNAKVFMRIDLSFGSREGGKLFWRWGNVF